jgi:glycosyltransferase involved in cell wall biosynthesis
MNKNKTLVLGLEHFIDKIGYQAMGYHKDKIMVRYLVIDTSGYSTDKATKFNADVVIVPKNLFLRILLTIKQVIMFRPDFLEVYDIGRITVFYTLLAKLFRLKCIVILRGGELRTKGIRKRGLLWGLRLCNHIIAKEYNILNDLEQNGVNRNKVSFLYNAVSVPTQNEINEYEYEERPIDILYLNSVRKMRNVHILVDALSELLLERPQLKVVLTGFTTIDHSEYKMETEYEEKIISLLKQKKLYERVTIKGFVREPNDYFKKSKIFVLPADIVFLNYSLLEAMSYGVLPVIGDGEGAEKIIESGANGFITKRDSKNLKNTLCEALDSKNKETIAKNARYTVIKKYSIEEWVREMVKIRNNI